MTAIRASLVYALVAAAGVACSGCARSETRGASAPAAGGAIEGAIQHPAHVIPAMRICAIGSGAPGEATHVCVDTRRDQGRYRIADLPADEYIVIAETEGDASMYRVGGYMQQVQCIRAPCPDMPKSVAVGQNATVDGIDIDRFYDAREDFPSLRNER